METQKPRQLFSSLDSLRGIAACWVCFYHMSWYFPGHSTLLMHNGYLFVDFFFVLSGFVICHAYMDRIQNKANLRDFVMMRLGRIYPIHLLFLVLFAGLEFIKYFTQSPNTYTNLAFERNTFPAFISNIFLTQALNLHPGLTFNGPSWSISVEFWTYIVFAMVILLARKYLIQSSLVIFVASITGLVFLTGHLNACYDYAIFRCLAGFFLGVICYRSFIAIKNNKLFEAPARATIAEVLIIIALIVFLAVKPKEHICDYILLPITFFLILIFAFESGSISKMLKTPVLAFLGKISYSIYMSHMLVITLFRQGMRQIGKVPLDAQGSFITSWPVGLAAALTALLLIVGIAALCYRFIEDPARKYVKDWLSRHPASGQPAKSN